VEVEDLGELGDFDFGWGWVEVGGSGDEEAQAPIYYVVGYI
jgi:hypothetical protein